MTIDLPDQLEQSTPYVEAEIVYRILGKLTDPTGLVGYLAFGDSPLDVPPADFTDSRWHAASWTTQSARHSLKLVVGPQGGTISLTPGVWYLFVGLTDGTQYPIMPAGTRTIR